MRRILDRSMEFICIVLFLFMILVGSYQIATRYFFNRPSTVSEELLTYTFTWMSLFAASYVFGKRDHMRMAFFAERFSARVQFILSICSELLILAFTVGVLGYGGISITRLTMTQQSPSLGIPMGYIYAILPICGAITLLYNLLNLKSLFAGLRDAKLPAGQKEE